MRHWPVVGKFLAIMGVFGIFSVGTTLYSANSMSFIDQSYSDLVDKSDKGALYLARSNRALQEVRAAIGDLLIANSEEGNARALKEIADNTVSFSTYMDTAIKALPDVAPLPDLKARGLQILREECGPAIAAGKAANEAVQNVAAQSIFLETCQPKMNEYSPLLVKTTNDVIARAAAESTALSAASRTIIVTSLAAVLAGLVLVLLAGYFAIRTWIVSPIRTLSGRMSKLAEGDLSLPIEGTDRRDEIGEMARSVDVFKQNGLEARNLASSAERTREAAEADRRRNEETERQRAQEMAQATSAMAAGLKHLAGGDLTFKLSEALAPDFEGLRADFNAAVDQLSETLRQISQATTAIDIGSREISQSAGDLSKRTEQQAASLEETAAALDQITANVSNASKRTEEARTVAIEANSSARQSGVVVSNAVDAMQRIEQSSAQISNIIGVIDEIAFQTNLLALNAGVEAARAGEAGKGFAVVAQEVRELAQRSAQAAKEIKGLIQASGSEVSNGVKLVRETGEALRIIETHVVTINQQLDAIATSAREQATGLAEVNMAVNQMDQVTQQNAAMVEESTAASSALASEANRMQQIVGQFRVAGSSRPSSPSGARSSAPPVMAPVRAAQAGQRPAPSPARQMMNKVAKAVGMSNSAAADNWEEF